MGCLTDYDLLSRWRLRPQIPSLWLFCFFSTLFYRTRLSSDKCVGREASVEMHYFLYMAVSFERCGTQCFVHAHHFYIWKPENCLKSSGSGWLEMNVSFTETLQDEWLTILGSKLCFDPQSYSSFSFPFFLFFFKSFIAPLSLFYLPFLLALNYHIKLPSGLYCSVVIIIFHSVRSHIFMEELINRLFLPLSVNSSPHVETFSFLGQHWQLYWCCHTHAGIDLKRDDCATVITF